MSHGQSLLALMTFVDCNKRFEQGQASQRCGATAQYCALPELRFSPAKGKAPAAGVRPVEAGRTAQTARGRWAHNDRYVSPQLRVSILRSSPSSQGTSRYLRSEHLG